MPVHPDNKIRLAVFEWLKIQVALYGELLDAAHIIPDNEGGEPVVQNGLSLCKLHHAAFDKYFIGINPDYYIEVCDEILQETDGPVLKYGLQKLHHQKILLPGPSKRPNQEWLHVRYQRFRKAI